MYPLMLDNLGDPEYFQKKTILAPTHEIVEQVNE